MIAPIKPMSFDFTIAVNKYLLYSCNIINQHPIGLEWKIVAKTTTYLLNQLLQ